MISIGSKEMVDCQVGSKKVKEIYKGSTKVWPSWNLLYEADIKTGGTNGTKIVATIPGFVSGTTKIKAVVSYVSGTWVTHQPDAGTGEQALQFGAPPKVPFVEFNADVSPLTIQYTSGNTRNFIDVSKAYQYDASQDATIQYKITPNGGLEEYKRADAAYVISDPVHRQVYYN